jgi:hypothetical protein
MLQAASRVRTAGCTHTSQSAAAPEAPVGPLCPLAGQVPSLAHGATHHRKLLDDWQDVRGGVLAHEQPRKRAAALHRQQPDRVLVCAAVAAGLGQPRVQRWLVCRLDARCTRNQMLDSPSCVSSWKMAVSSLLTYSGSTASANLLRLAAAARRTMGVSSWVRSRYKFRSSVLSAVGARRYAVASRPQADTRDVNQSPVASRCARALAVSRCRPQPPRQLQLHG